jgi:hypothetical protein
MRHGRCSSPLVSPKPVSRCGKETLCLFDPWIWDGPLAPSVVTVSLNRVSVLQVSILLAGEQGRTCNTATAVRTGGKQNEVRVERRENAWEGRGWLPVT